MMGIADASQGQHGQEDPNSSGDESDVSLEGTPGVPLGAPTLAGVFCHNPAFIWMIMRRL